MTHRARWGVAVYDGDITAALRMIQTLLERFPGDGALLMAKLGALHELGLRVEYRAALEAIGSGRDADPTFQRLLAELWAQDAATTERARRRLDRALRHAPLDAATFRALAELEWRRGARTEALALHRYAACIEDAKEDYAASYFLVARHIGEADGVLEFLRARVETSGSRASGPARTLAWALELLHRDAESLGTLDRALERRPDDGELLLHAAKAFAEAGQAERAGSLMARAESRCRRASWLVVDAELGRRRGDLKEALARYHEALALQPLDIGAQIAVTELLECSEGVAAAVAYIDKAAIAHPHFLPLQRMRVQRSTSQGQVARESAARDLAERWPDDAWAWRELGFAQVDARRFEEAEAAARRALALDPTNVATHALLGLCQARRGELASAASHYRDALECEADEPGALNGLLESVPGPEARRSELASIRERMLRKPCLYFGLMTYRRLAWETVGPAELLAELQAAYRARPDIWSTGVALAEHLISCDRIAESLAVATETTDRFPSVHWAWLRLAQARSGGGDDAAEIAALERAVEVAPGAAESVLTLAHRLLEQGDGARASRVLERAITIRPLDASLHAEQALGLWRSGEHSAALSRIEYALDLDAGLGHAWESLRLWAAEIGDPGRGARLARAQAERDPGHAERWLRCAMEADPAKLDEAIAALDRALEVDPWLEVTHDLKATLLAQAGKFDEALAVCQAPVWGGAVPHRLRGRAAWVMAARGDVAGAIAAIEAVLAEEPRYLFGLWQLAGWHGERGDVAARVAVAKRLVDLVPRDPAALELLARTAGDHGDAATQRAMVARIRSIDPTSYFAGLVEADALAAESRHDEAVLLLARIQPRDAFVVARLVKLDARACRALAARERFEELVALPQESRWPLEQAYNAISQVQTGSGVIATLEQAAFRAGTSPYVGYMLVKALLDEEEGAVAHRLVRRLRGLGDIGVQADVAIIDDYVRRRAAIRLRLHVKRFGGALRRDVRLWAHIGYALVELQAMPAAAQWLADHEVFEGVEAWMLWNLAQARRRTGRWRLALAIHREALRLSADDTTPLHAAWAAGDLAVAGEREEAERCLAVARAGNIGEASERQVSPEARAVQIAEAVLLTEGTPEERFASARSILASAVVDVRPLDNHQPDVWNLYLRATRRVARTRGGVRAALWCLAKHITPI